MNYFHLYDLPVSFLVDEKIIKERYLALSRKTHPDFFAGAGAEKQAEMLQLSTQNNKAFQTLSNFDKRIKYILMEKGYLVEEEKFALPQMFLMEMMDLNEEVMDIQMEPDEQKKQTVIKKIEEVESLLLEEISPTLNAFIEETAVESDYLSIKEFYYKRKYILRLKSQLEKLDSPDEM